MGNLCSAPIEAPPSSAPLEVVKTRPIKTPLPEIAPEKHPHVSDPAIRPPSPTVEQGRTSSYHKACGRDSKTKQLSVAQIEDLIGKPEVESEVTVAVVIQEDEGINEDMNTADTNETSDTTETPSDPVATEEPTEEDAILSPPPAEEDMSPPPIITESEEEITDNTETPQGTTETTDASEPPAPEIDLSALPPPSPIVTAEDGPDATEPDAEEEGNDGAAPPIVATEPDVVEDTHDDDLPPPVVADVEEDDVEEDAPVALHQYEATPPVSDVEDDEYQEASAPEEHTSESGGLRHAKSALTEDKRLKMKAELASELNELPDDADEDDSD